MRLVNKYGVSKSAICYHIKNLIDLGLLQKRPKSINKIDNIILENLDKNLLELSLMCNKSQTSIASRLYVLKKFNKISSDYIVKIIDTSINHSTNLSKWTKDEIILLKELISKQGLSTLSKNLNKCTFDICMKYHELNNMSPLSFYKNSKDYLFWTYDKDMYLFLNFETGSMEDLCVNTKASWKKIYRRATILGLDRKEVNFNMKTSLEISVQNLLNTINPNFKSQFKINYNTINKNKYYIADFIFIDLKLIIEAQGDYWHGNPIRFPNPSEFQLSKISNDLNRKNILESLGYTVLYIWEYDMKNNLNSVEADLKKVLLPV